MFSLYWFGNVIYFWVLLRFTKNVCTNTILSKIFYSGILDFLVFPFVFSYHHNYQVLENSLTKVEIAHEVHCAEKPDLKTMSSEHCNLHWWWMHHPITIISSHQGLVLRMETAILFIKSLHKEDEENPPKIPKYCSQMHERCWPTMSLHMTLNLLLSELSVYALYFIRSLFWLADKMVDCDALSNLWYSIVRSVQCKSWYCLSWPVTYNINGAKVLGICMVKSFVLTISITLLNQCFICLFLH